MEEWGYECSVCGEKATQVHHFFPKGRFGHLRYDIDNGVPICQSCHFKHHHIGDPRINQEIIDVRGMKWYRELEKKSKKKPTSYQTIAWYKDNIKRLEKELEEK
jgi:5-methylcytosine-specific restriction endonuclease McrA